MLILFGWTHFIAIGSEEAEDNQLIVLFGKASLMMWSCKSQYHFTAFWSVISVPSHKLPFGSFVLACHPVIPWFCLLRLTSCLLCDCNLSHLQYVLNDSILVCLWSQQWQSVTMLLTAWRPFVFAFSWGLDCQDGSHLCVWSGNSTNSSEWICFLSHSKAKWGFVYRK